MSDDNLDKVCKICGKKLNTLRGLSSHIRQVHKYSLEKYYLRYINNNNICKYIKCSNTTKFISLGSGFHNYCSYKCSANDRNYHAILKKRKQTNLRKYGVENVAQLKGTQEKIKQTNLRKYGVENVFQSDEIKEKIKKTNKEKYGVDWYVQTDDFKEKAQSTNIRKYNNKCYQSTDDFKEKIKSTMLKKYNVEHYSQTNEFKVKRHETIKSRYNVDSLWDLQSYRHSIEQTNLQKYGNIYYFGSEEYKKKQLQFNNNKYNRNYFTQLHIENYNNLNKDYWLNNFLNKKRFLLLDKICEYYNITKSTAYLYRKRFGLDDYFFHTDKYRKQNEIFNLIKFTYNKNLNNRVIIKPYEIDIYLPEYHLAIEFNGLMFHSYGKSKSAMFNNYNNIDKYYHLNKTKLCNKKNIHLIHIFENEWDLNKEIILSIIKSYCNTYDSIIYARKCEMREIKNNEYKNFIINNHIQGYVPSKIKLGLYYNKELVSVMSFGKSRYNKKYKWELLRFCNKLNSKVIGGASKLFKYFINNYYDNSGIISYCDRRYFKGTLYQKLGFKFSHYSEPNYFYFYKNNIYELYHRTAFQKHKLSSLLDNFDINKTEMENMFDNGYRVIYDCGQGVWVYK